MSILNCSLDFNTFNTYTDDEQAIVSDAEKAFISMMESKYNEIKFRQYSQGEDGLYSKGLWEYSYSINYNLSMFTDKGCIIRKYDDYNRDAIIIQGDQLNIIKA